MDQNAITDTQFSHLAKHGNVQKLLHSKYTVINFCKHGYDHGCIHKLSNNHGTYSCDQKDCPDFCGKSMSMYYCCFECKQIYPRCKRDQHPCYATKAPIKVAGKKRSRSTQDPCSNKMSNIELFSIPQVQYSTLENDAHNFEECQPEPNVNFEILETPIEFDFLFQDEVSLFSPQDLDDIIFSLSESENDDSTENLHPNKM